MVAPQAMMHAFDDDLCLTAHGADTPTKQDWSAYVEQLRARGKQTRGVLVHTRGGGPDAWGRKLISDMWRAVGRNPPIAVLTDSAALRVMMNALNWMLQQPMRAFGLAELDAALDHLSITDTRRREQVKLGLNALVAKLEQHDG